MPINGHSIEGIARRIFLIRGHKVMLDSDLALIYRVSTRRLNEQVRRNMPRFPIDFMFQLSLAEYRSCHPGAGRSPMGRGGRRKLPLVFTQEGVAALSGVLNSPQAIQANIAIMRAFVRQRQTLELQKDMARKLDDLQRHVKTHDGEITSIFKALRALLNAPEPPRRRIGFAGPP